MERASLPDTLSSTAREEWPFEVGLVRLGDLIVDDEYQRPPHHQFVSEIATHFDETLVGCLDVNERANGTLAVLDGQQRLLAMRQIGKRTCYASLYPRMSLADEAGFFYRKNKDRKSMGAYYSFRARTIAGDPEAALIREAIEAEGFVLAPASNDREAIGAIRAVEMAWALSSPHRDQSLTPTLRTIRHSLYGRKDSLNGWLIQGISRFWQNYPDEEVDADIVSSAIGTIGAQGLIGMAREKQAFSTTSSSGGKVSLPWVMARVIAEEYNRVLRGGRRGAFEGRLDTRRLGI